MSPTPQPDTEHLDIATKISENILNNLKTLTITLNIRQNANINRIELISYLPETLTTSLLLKSEENRQII